MTKTNQIMVVEDDEDIRSQIVQILKDEGYTTSSSVNGKKALEDLSQRSSSEYPDCILLDLMMPMMNGLEFFKALRSRPEFDSIKVLLATAKGSVDGVVPGMPADLPVINKPMDIDELVAAIQELIGVP